MGTLRNNPDTNANVRNRRLRLGLRDEKLRDVYTNAISNVTNSIFGDVYQI